MKLNHHLQALIAVGAAISANCQPCLQSATAFALENGVDEQEIAEAIEVGKKVRAGAASKMDQFIADCGQTAKASSDSGCGCYAKQS
jgi:AhpD family alkylhydroperoxidase